MKKYDIYIADYKKTKILQMPIPMTPPAITTPIQNETFDTYWNGSFLFIEKAGLKTLTLSGWLPNQIYNFARSKLLAPEILELFQNAIDNTEPIIVIIVSTDGQMYLNEIFAIESFEKTARKNGDIEYSLSLKQFREYINVIKKTYTVGWEQNDTGWYYYTDVSGNYYNDSWQLIDNEWYSFDPQGYARQATWFKDGLEWYYFKYTCKMARNEWLEVESKWYYFASNGAMYHSGTFEIDGDYYSFDSDGSWI